MDESLALHSAVRRYLGDRSAELGAVGAAAPPTADGLAAAGPAACFRYLDALRDEVERLDPDALPPVAELAPHLCDEALTMPVATGDSDIAHSAVRAERLRTVERIEYLAARDLSTVEPLPYRRTLSSEESAWWLAQIRERWFEGKNDSWALFGASMERTRDDVLLLRQEAFWAEPVEIEAKGTTYLVLDGLGPAATAVQAALESMGVPRVVVIREWGASRELSAVGLEPHYGEGGEGLFTSAGQSWLLHASHEDVYTLGGAIVAPFQRAWPGWRAAEWSPS